MPRRRSRDGPMRMKFQEIADRKEACLPISNQRRFMSPRDAVLTLDSPSYFPQQCESRARHDLLSPRLESSDGSGPAINVGDLRGKLAVVSMMINHVAEHEWLALSVWGSIDGEDWGATPLATLPRKGYCGVY